MGSPKIPYRLTEFVKLHRQVEGVIQHVGLGTWDLLLIDASGLWDRDEFSTEEAANDACLHLGIRAHYGWDDARLARRVNARDQWNSPDGQRRAL
jgi:hypothetical protein